jgi:hypothetical protein
MESLYLDPEYVSEYLKNHDWQKNRDIGEIATVFYCLRESKRYEIILPIDTELVDYDSRVDDFLRVLSIVEKRSKSDIVKTLSTAGFTADIAKTEAIQLRFISQSFPHKHSFPARDIGNILSSLQELFDSVGQFASGKSSDKGPISQEIKENTRLSVSETFQGSFGVKLIIEPTIQPTQLGFLDELSGESLPEIVSEWFLNLLEASREEHEVKLRTLLQTLNKRSSIKYRSFLKAIMQSNSDVDVDWGSQNPQKGKRTFLSKNDAISTIEIINKVEDEEPLKFSFVGKLISSMSEKEKAEFENIENEDEKYWASISNQDVDRWVGSLVIRDTYNVEIEEVTSINLATGEEKVDRKVVALCKYKNSES